MVGGGPDHALPSPYLLEGVWTQPHPLIDACRCPCLRPCPKEGGGQEGGQEGRLTVDPGWPQDMAPHNAAVSPTGTPSIVLFVRDENVALWDPSNTKGHSALCVIVLWLTPLF